MSSSSTAPPSSSVPDLQCWCRLAVLAVLLILPALAQAAPLHLAAPVASLHRPLALLAILLCELAAAVVLALLYRRRPRPPVPLAAPAGFSAKTTVPAAAPSCPRRQADTGGIPLAIYDDDTEEQTVMGRRPRRHLQPVPLVGFGEEPTEPTADGDLRAIYASEPVRG